MSGCVLIVDDHVMMVRAIRSLLCWHSIPVCGDARNGQEAIERVKEMHPAVVILDVKMPVMDGIAAAQEIRRIAADTKILFFTVIDNPGPTTVQALGSDAWIPKSAAETMIPELKRLLRIEDHP